MTRKATDPIAVALLTCACAMTQACGSPQKGATNTPSGGNNATGGENNSSAGAAAGAGAGGRTGQAATSGGASESSAGASAAGGQSVAGTSSAGDTGNAAGAAGTPSSAGGARSCDGAGSNATLPQRSRVLSAMQLSNDYFMHKWADPTIAIVTDKTRPSNIWTRAVYYEGLMALYAVEPDEARKASYYDYAVTWGASAAHPWQLAGGGTTTRSADNQCCGQTYLDLYQIDAQPIRARDIKADIDAVVSGSSNGDWSWVDAIQMAMPVFAKLGVSYGSDAYFEKMHSLYVNAKTTQGFYNSTDHLWWRDATFEPPFKTPNGKQCYWSRGNGWVFAALTRVLDITPAGAPYRAEYSADFQAMAIALSQVQRSDGFWNVSLADPDDHGGPELTGTALFTYGLAWGIRQGLLDRATYEPIVSLAWCAMSRAVHDDGFLGFAQGSGSKPADGQPVTFDSVPDFEDFPTGCFLLGASEVWKLAAP